MTTVNASKTKVSILFLSFLALCFIPFVAPLMPALAAIALALYTKRVLLSLSLSGLLGAVGVYAAKW